MATITSVGSGLWSAAGTWDAGVPADGDSIVISAGHTIEFDVDQSAWATGIYALTNAATSVIKLTRTAGTYCMKLRGGMTVNFYGTIDAGTIDDPIPNGTKHHIWWLAGNGGFNGQYGGIIKSCGANPTYKYVKTSGVEAVGQTRLEVDTDVSGDIWTVGDTIRICDINGYDAQTTTISGIGAGYIDITDALTAEKSAGSYVVLMERNVKFEMVQAGSSWGFVRYSNKEYIFINTYFPQSGANGILQEPSTSVTNYFEGCTFAVYRYASKDFYTRYVDCIFTGDAGADTDYSFATASYPAFTDCIFIGHYKTYFPKTISPIFRNCKLIGCERIFWLTYGVELYDCEFMGNGANLFETYGKMKNCLFSSGDDAMSPRTNEYPLACSVDHNQVSDAYKAWSLGGITASVSSPLPSGFGIAYLTTLSSAADYGYWNKLITVPAGKTVNIDVRLRKSASMAYLPRIWVALSKDNPFHEPDMIVDSFTMTDSVDTWESHSFSIMNSTAFDREYMIWFVGKNASGSMYAAYVAEIAGGGGGGISRARIIGGV
jgi:hypothetical protein